MRQSLEWIRAHNYKFHFDIAHDKSWIIISIHFSSQKKSSNLEIKSRTRNWCGKKAHFLIGTPKSTLQYGQSGICDLTFSIFPKLSRIFGFQNSISQFLLRYLLETLCYKTLSWKTLERLPQKNTILLSLIVFY